MAGPLGPTDRGSRTAAYPQVYEGVSGSESGTCLRPRRRISRPRARFKRSDRRPGAGWRGRYRRTARNGQQRRRPPLPPPATRAPGAPRAELPRASHRRRRAPRPGPRPAGSARRRPSDLEQRPGRSRRSRGPRRWAPPRVRERFTVRKSANRTLIETVRPTCPARRSRPPTLVAERQQRPADHLRDRRRRRRTWSRRRSTSPRARCDTRRGSRPQASSCRWAAAASPSARRSIPSGASATSPTVRSPSRRSVSAACSPTPHSASTGSGCRNSSTRSAGTTMQAVRLGPGGAELGDELRRRHPDRAGQPLLLGDPPADRARRSRPAGRAAAGRRPRRGTPRPGTAARPAG